MGLLMSDVSHVKVYNQNIDSLNENLALIEEKVLPAIIIELTENNKYVKVPLQVLKNLFDLEHGDTPLYIALDGQEICAGKVDYTIDNIHLIKSLLFKANIYLEKVAGVREPINVEDLVGTLRIGGKDDNNK